MIDQDEVRNLSLQVALVGEFSCSMLGDMAVDRGGPEDRAYRALVERIDDIIERNAELVRTLSDGSDVSHLTLRRVSADYPTRARAFMGMRDMVNQRLNNLAGDIVSDPFHAARRMVSMENSYIRLSNLFEEVIQARYLNRTLGVPFRTDDIRHRSEPHTELHDDNICSICLEAIGDASSVCCAACNKRLHEACLLRYRWSAGPDVPCPTCRRGLS